LSTSVVHVEPVQPALHVHENEATPSLHVAPFWQGDDVHSATLISQL
jgi:hypothetical protein